MRFKVIIYCCILISCSCKKECIYHDTIIVGHAGAGLDVIQSPFSENTQESINYAINIGVTSIELDVQLSSDGELYLFHDEKLDSKTNSTGCIASKTISEMDSVHYSFSPFSSVPKLNSIDFKGVEILFLDVRVLNSCLLTFVDFNLLTNKLVSFIEKTEVPTVIITSRHKEWLLQLKELGLNICLEATSFNALKLAIDETAIPLFEIRNREISASEVQWIHDNNRKVVIFDAKSTKGNSIALKKKPDFLMTDALESAVRLRMKDCKKE
jgi:glycerophosphoryl diester phosphodiesterase